MTLIMLTLTALGAAAAASRAAGIAARIGSTTISDKDLTARVAGDLAPEQKEGKYQAAVAADLRGAEQLGIGDTPASFVNGRYADGALSEAEFATLVDDELTRVMRENRGSKH